MAVALLAPSIYNSTISNSTFNFQFLYPKKDEFAGSVEKWKKSANNNSILIIRKEDSDDKGDKSKWFAEFKSGKGTFSEFEIDSNSSFGQFLATEIKNSNDVSLKYSTCLQAALNSRLFENDIFEGMMSSPTDGVSVKFGHGSEVTLTTKENFPSIDHRLNSFFICFNPTD